MEKKARENDQKGKELSQNLAEIQRMKDGDFLNERPAPLNPGNNRYASFFDLFSHN
jgi:hypothetical protein